MEMLQPEKIAELIHLRIREAGDTASFGDHLDVRFGGYCAESGSFLITMHPKNWMCNPSGVIHGGICATMADQAMGLVAYGVHGGTAIAPTIQMQISLHRPVMPERNVLLRVRIVSASKNLINMAAEGYCEEGKVCFSATGIFFRT